MEGKKPWMEKQISPLDTDSVFWSRIKLQTAFIHSGAANRTEVEAGESKAKLYRVGKIIRIDVRFGGEK